MVIDKHGEGGMGRMDPGGCKLWGVFEIWREIILTRHLGFKCVESHMHLLSLTWSRRLRRRLFPLFVFPFFFFSLYGWRLITPSEDGSLKAAGAKTLNLSK